MFRTFAIALTAISFTGLALADDKKKDDKDKPAFSGIWVREAGGHNLKIEFTGKDSFKLSAFVEENGAVVTCKYSVKDGVLKSKVTKVEVKGDFKAAPKEGAEFCFKWKVKGETATLDDFDAPGLEAAKPVLEGEYAKQKGKD